MSRNTKAQGRGKFNISTQQTQGKFNMSTQETRNMSRDTKAQWCNMSPQPRKISHSPRAGKISRRAAKFLINSINGTRWCMTNPSDSYRQRGTGVLQRVALVCPWLPASKKSLASGTIINSTARKTTYGAKIERVWDTTGATVPKNAYRLHKLASKQLLIIDQSFTLGHDIYSSAVSTSHPSFSCSIDGLVVIV
eukprot:g26965.t1